VESGEVRQAWEQVNGRPRRPEEVECAAARGCSEKIGRLRCGHGARPGLRYWGGNGGYDRARSAAADDLPVLTESLVGLGDHTAGDLKPSGQQATCREPAADRQPAVADRPAKLGGQPVRKRASRGFGQIELQKSAEWLLARWSAPALDLFIGPSLQQG
jgi:hypothetical protein